MEFAIENCSKYDKYESYKPILEKYNLRVEIVEDFCYYDDDDDKSEMYHVTINSLEELLQFKKDIGHDIIIQDEYRDRFCNYYNGKCIKIWDGFIG